MKIRIDHKLEEWNLEKWEKAFAHSSNVQRIQESKDWDEAWLSQWAASSMIHRLHLIKEILDSPMIEIEWGIKCPNCSNPTPRRHGKYGSFFACPCDFKSGETKKLEKWLSESPDRVIRKSFPKGIAFNAVGNAYIIADKETQR